MLAIIRCRIFWRPVSYPKIWGLRYAELQFCLLFCMGVNLGRSYWGRNVGWGFLRIGLWGEYLGLRNTRELKSEENYTISSLMICTPHQTFFRLIKSTSSLRLKHSSDYTEHTRLKPLDHWFHYFPIRLKKITESLLLFCTYAYLPHCNNTFFFLFKQENLRTDRWHL